MVALAAINRSVAHRAARILTIPRIVAALRSLRRNATMEIAAGMIVVAIVGLLGTMVPAAHQSPAWPFAFTLSWQAAQHDRSGVGAGVVAAGIVACVAAGAAIRWRAPQAVARRGRAGFGGHRSPSPRFWAWLLARARVSDYLRGFARTIHDGPRSPAAPVSMRRVALSATVPMVGVTVPPRRRCPGCRRTSPRTRRVIYPGNSSGGSRTAFRERRCRDSPAPRQPTKSGIWFNSCGPRRMRRLRRRLTGRAQPWRYRHRGARFHVRAGRTGAGVPEAAATQLRHAARALYAAAVNAVPARTCRRSRHASGSRRARHRHSAVWRCRFDRRRPARTTASPIVAITSADAVSVLCNVRASGDGSVASVAGTGGLPDRPPRLRSRALDRRPGSPLDRGSAKRSIRRSCLRRERQRAPLPRGAWALTTIARWGVAR